MRQLGEGVQSEERQMLLPFLRHLSLRTCCPPAATAGPARGFGRKAFDLDEN
jgi:hypothetical protein